MKTIYRLCIAAAAISIMAACETQEPHKFLFEDEAINFYSRGEMYNQLLPEMAYPSELTKSYSPNTWSNRNKKATKIIVDFSVQTQGYIRDFDRKAVMVANETTGWQIPLPVTELIVPGGEYTVVYDTIPIDHVPFGRMTTWVIGFDYEKGDFVPGNIERQIRTITIDNRYTISSVNLKANYWESYLQGSDQTPGFGTWSNIKTMFLVETFGIVNFEEIRTIARQDPDEFARMVTEAAQKLEEYKTKSASDPVAYPPLLDDEINDGSWIKFND